MGIIKDWNDENGSYVLHYKVLRFLSPNSWMMVYKWRKQRADRGWSDKDTWAAGEYILQISSAMLRELGKEKNPVDWASYFKDNQIKHYGYSNFNEAADDIDAYLNFSANSSWTDYIDFKLPGGHINQDGSWESGMDKRQQFKAKKAMEKHNREFNHLHEKASKAMRLVASNHGALWW